MTERICQKVQTARTNLLELQRKAGTTHEATRFNAMHTILRAVCSISLASLYSIACNIYSVITVKLSVTQKIKMAAVLKGIRNSPFK